MYVYVYCVSRVGRIHVIVSCYVHTLSAVVYNYNNNINIIIMSINTFKVRDGRIRVYKKYVYKYVPFLSGRLVVEGHIRLLYLFRLSPLSQSLTSALCRLTALSCRLYPVFLSRCTPMHSSHILTARCDIHTRSIQSRPTFRIYHYTSHQSHDRITIIIIIINIHIFAII